MERQREHETEKWRHRYRYGEPRRQKGSVLAALSWRQEHQLRKGSLRKYSWKEKERMEIIGTLPSYIHEMDKESC